MLSGFLGKDLYDAQLFSAMAGANDWQRWRKPIGKVFAYMLCLGSGAGGSTGGNNSNGGGNGGGSGAISRLIIPLDLLPDVLYIQVGLGGAGAASGNFSYISDQQVTTVTNLYLKSGHAVPTSTGTQGTIATSVADCTLAGAGVFVALAGQAGGTGGSTSVGGSVNALGSLIVTGGAGGGGGANNAGGNITGQGLFPTILGGAGTTGANASDGAFGIILNGNTTGFMACGGAGGGATSGSGKVGGKGGNGNIGSGGGGGGAGAASGIGGVGGIGGDGFVGIWCW